MHAWPPTRSSVETQPPQRKRGRRPAIDAAKDQLIQDAMQRHGTTNARIIQDELARAHSVQLTYEVVRKRVKQLGLQAASASAGARDDATASAVEAENESSAQTKTGSSDNAATTFADTTGLETSADTLAGHLRIARDLDMLAETVRTIVSSVQGNGESETSDIAYNSESRESGDGSNSHSTDIVAAGGDRGFTEDNASVSTNQTKKPANEAPLSFVISTQSAGEEAASASPITTRRRKYGEYSTELREACVRKHEQEGLTYATISRQLSIPHDTVRAIVRKAKKTGSVHTAPRSGRPRKTNDIVDKVIVQAVKTNHRCTAKMIQEDLLAVFNVKVSCETVRRRVKANLKTRQASTPQSHETTQQPASPVFPVTSALSTSPPPPPPPLASTDTGTFFFGNVSPAAFSSAPSPTGAPMHTSSPIALTPLPAQACNQIPQHGLAPHSAIHSILNFHEHQTSKQEHRAIHMASSKSSLSELSAGISAAAHQHIGYTSVEATSDPSSSTRKKRNEYSVEVREQCVAMHARGHGYRRIGQELSMPHTTVRAIVEKAQRTGTVLPAARSGRPRKTDEIVDRVILQVVRSNEKCSARMIQEELQTAYGVKVSCETIRRRVKDHTRQRHSADPDSSSFATTDAIEASSSVVFEAVPAEDAVGSAGGYPASAIEALVAPAEGRAPGTRPRSFQEQLHLQLSPDY